ncbi:MAG: aminotransferase class I/II-fold pyridoxal phosphate-dependent enzyme, partial [Muribaculaceae bacterium]|nr:aminotransferase class I/II-fold pyridoxal phosphate-dependent enzyme [Muribaculaceae bacterium]
ASDPETTLMILCNPHNPAARVWTREELRRIGEICNKNNVTVVSDEIHCELTFDGYAYTPYASLSDELAWHSVCCNSPSKAFNTAGLQIANIVTPDPVKRAKIDRAINDNEVCDVNPFGIVGLIAAYTQGGEWLEGLKKYLWSNYQWIKEAFETHLPQLKLTPIEATYLLWVNIAATGLNSDQLCDTLVREARVMLSPGSIYGPGGDNFVRINLATQRSRLEDAFERMLPILSSLQH